MRKTGQQRVKGGAWAELSPQQGRIVLMLLARKCDKEIAHELHISRATLRTHFGRAFRRFGVHDRLGLILELLERDPGLLARRRECGGILEPRAGESAAEA